MQALSMNRWPGLAIDAVWFFGLVVMLTTFGYHRWLAADRGVPFRELRARRSWILSWSLALVLVCVGVAFGICDDGWERVVLSVAALGFLVPFLRALPRPHRQTDGPLRVLLISQYFWPESFPITNFVRALRDTGCRLTVLTGQPNYPGPDVFPGYRAYGIGWESHPDGYTVMRVPVVPRRRATAIRLGANYCSFVISAMVFGPLLTARGSYDVVLVYAPSPVLQSIPAIWVGWLRQVPVALWVQDLWPESLSSTGHVTSRSILRAVEAVVRWIYRHCDLLLGQSPAFVTAIRPLAGGTPTEYFPNPADGAFGAPSDGETEPALRLESGFNVVFAGNLGTVQALDTILEAAELLRDDLGIRFVLIGRGSRLPWLATEVVRRELRSVVLPGHFPLEAMPAILAQASVLLVSLQRNPTMSQTIPTKIQAYLAVGRPILASMDGEGARLVVESGAGLATPAEDAAALAQAVRALRDSTEAERRRMGAAGRRCFEEHFTASRLASLLVARLRALSDTGDQ